MLKKIWKGVKNPRLFVEFIMGKWCCRFLPDEIYLKIYYFIKIGRKLNLDQPETLNEKLQWLKLYDRRPEYTTRVDKYAVRQYIADIIGDEYLIPLLGVWDDPEDIDFESLPEQFVLKCNHNSGLGMYICKDKSALDIPSVRKGLRRGLEQDYYYHGREWPYKNVKRRIIAEQYMVDGEQTDGLTDYKFYCFNGNVDCVLVCLDRFSEDKKFYFFDQDWTLKRYNKRGLMAPEGFTVQKPPEMDEMFSIAKRLSEGYAFIRVDLYCSCGQIYFGELTFYPDSGFDANRLRETDLYFGSMVKLYQKKKG